MKVSIIIPVYNRKDYTQKCLESVFSVGAKYPFEIIVVDNSSSDGTKEFLESLGNRIVTIRNEKNLGFAKACNQGAKIAQGEYLLFLNNDTIVTKGWVDVLVEELDSNSNTSIAGSKLLFPDETIQHAGVVFGADKIPHHIHYREPKDKHYVSKRRKFQAVTAACMIIRKESFNKVGGFDEQYLNGYEDIDLCLKIGLLKGDVMYCPQSVVYHYESISEGRGDCENHKKNRDLLLKKWGDKILFDEYWYLKEDGTINQAETIRLQKIEIAYLMRQLDVIKSSRTWKLLNVYSKSRQNIVDLFKKMS
jgi:GT2 family glycosyltransferase